MSDVSASEEAPRPRAVRLIFEYDGDEVRLISQQRVDVAVTGFDLAGEAGPGHYVEMRDAAGDAVARVPVPEAFAHTAEVFPEQPGEPITRVDVERPRGAFTVVVPAPESAQRVAVVRIAPTPPAVPRVDAGTTSRLPGAPEVVDLATFALEPGT